MKWYDESYLTRERYACRIKGVGIIVVERCIDVSCNWLMCESDLIGPLDLGTTDLEVAKTLAMQYMRRAISDMIQTIDEMIDRP